MKKVEPVWSLHVQQLACICLYLSVKFFFPNQKQTNKIHEKNKDKLKHKNKGTKINHLSSSDGEGCKDVGTFSEDAKELRNCEHKKTPQKNPRRPKRKRKKKVKTVHSEKQHRPLWRRKTKKKRKEKVIVTTGEHSALHLYK